MPHTTFRTVEISDPAFESDGMRCITVKSAALRRRADLTVWAPEAAAPGLPLVILLHGVFGSHWAWALKGGAHRTAARLIAAGEIPPLALAMPSDGLWGDGSGYIRHGSGPDYAAWITDEVPAAAALAVPFVTHASPLFIAGLSMGGYGALRLTASFPDRFSGCSAHSACTELAHLDSFVEEDMSTTGAPAGEQSVLDLMVAAGRHLPPVRFDCGISDPLLPHNRELHAGLTKAGIGHQYEEYAGGHDWPYWHEHLADSLRFFAGLHR